MPERRRKIVVDECAPSIQRSLLVRSIGEVVEWFDFMVYLSVAPVLAQVFFASGSKTSLLVMLGVLAAAFMARPLAAVFGQLGDRLGRKRALIAHRVCCAARGDGGRPC